MSTCLLAVVAILYLGAALSLAWSREWPMAMVFTCYGIAQLGLIWAMARGGAA